MNRRKKEALIHILAFFALLIVPTLIWGILSLTGVSEKLNFDTGENRNPFSFDEDLSLGNLTAELESYYNDRVPFRSILLQCNKGLETVVEFPYRKGIEPVLIALANIGTDKTETAPAPAADAVSGPDVKETGSSEAAVTPVPTLPPVDTGFFPFKDLGNGVIQGREDWLFFADTLNDYAGEDQLDDFAMEYHTQTLQDLRALCSAKGIELKFLGFPNKNTIYGEYMPTYESTGVHKLQQLEDYVKANTDLDFEFLNEELTEQKPLHEMYYHQDTHWTTWGVLTGVNTLYKMIGVPLIDPSSLTIEEIMRDQPGDLAQMASLADPASEIYTKMTYKPEIKESVVWDDLMDETHERCVSHSAASDPRSLVIVGDSFVGHSGAGNFMEFLPQDFAQVTYINTGKISMDDAEAVRGADILVIECVERNFERVFGDSIWTVFDILES